MSSSLRRGALAATFALSIAPLAACGAGFDAETDGVRPDNAAVQVDDIMIQNANLVLGGDAAGPAAVTARIFNAGDTDQTLLGITLPASGAAVELLPAEGESRIVIPAGGSVALNGEGNPTAYVADAEAAGVAMGNAQQLVFDLSETGDASLHARVVPMDGDFSYYADWGPVVPGLAAEEPEAAAEETAGTDAADGQDEDDTSDH